MIISKRLKYILIAILTVAMMLSLVCASASGSPLSDYKKKQKDLQSKMEEQLKTIKKERKNTKNLESQIEEYDIQITKLIAEMQEADVQLKSTQKQIDKTNKELKETEVRLAARNEALADRIKEIYVTGDISLMDVLFESNSYNDFLVRYDMAQKIMDRDVDLIDQINSDKVKIEESKAVLEERASDLNALKTSKATSKSSLESLQAEKGTMLKAAKEDLQTAQEDYAAMEKASNEVAAELQALYNKGGGYNPPSNGGGNSSGGNYSPPKGGGSLSMPIANYSCISANYGYYPSGGKHTGIDFAAPIGTPIYSAGNGVVISVKYLNYSYGYHVIIDHGNRISTLYAHMSSISVSPGQTVSAGQKIGGVGSTGRSTGPHLHFEVRVNGNHTNPAPYIGL
ncbi:MAG: murein hydrolase activator EnvC family protein [Bacillota bacterium]|jgi:murein DD-endopeptidase MepM/ murein hydrolase activator NlpD